MPGLDFWKPLEEQIANMPETPTQEFHQLRAAPIGYRSPARPGPPDRRAAYTGLADGRVVAVEPEHGAAREVTNTGGRPLGLEATADGRLLIRDSPKGLVELDLRTGALKTLVTHDDAVRLVFCSNVVAAPDGDLLFTSLVYALRRPGMKEGRRRETTDRAGLSPGGGRRADAADGRLAPRQRPRADARRKKSHRRRVRRISSASSVALRRLRGNKRRDRGASRLSRQSRRRRRRPRLGRFRLGTEPGARKAAQTAALYASAGRSPAGRHAAEAVCALPGSLPMTRAGRVHANSNGRTAAMRW